MQAHERHQRFGAEEGRAMWGSQAPEVRCAARMRTLERNLPCLKKSFVQPIGYAVKVLAILTLGVVDVD